MATRLSTSADRTPLVAIVALALSARFALALGIQAFAPGDTRGFVTGDDAAYHRIASLLAHYIADGSVVTGYEPPIWGGLAYLVRTYVWVQVGLYLVLGVDVRYSLLLNGAISVATAVLVYSLARQLFPGRAALGAAAIVALFPSTLLWSSLNLKDAMTVGLAVLALWSAIVLRPRIWGFVVAFAAAEALLGLRAYVAVAVAASLLMTASAIALPPRRRLAVTCVAAAVAGTIAYQALGTLEVAREGIVATVEDTRGAMAIGARTGYVPSATPVASEPSGSWDSVARSVAHMPVGAAYALFAPFPWAPKAAQDVAAAPEMLLWYVLLAFACATAWRHRARWRELAGIAVFVVVLVGVFALAEGNAGTLFRHRGMIVPMVALLAAPGVASYLQRVAPQRGIRAGLVSPSRES